MFPAAANGLWLHVLARTRCCVRSEFWAFSSARGGSHGRFPERVPGDLRRGSSFLVLSCHPPFVELSVQVFGSLSNLVVCFLVVESNFF